jgi:hypothetical protein
MVLTLPVLESGGQGKPIGGQGSKLESKTSVLEIGLPHRRRFRVIPLEEGTSGARFQPFQAGRTRRRTGCRQKNPMLSSWHFDDLAGSVVSPAGLAKAVDQARMRVAGVPADK